MEVKTSSRFISPTLARTVTSGREKVRLEGRCRICATRELLTRHHLVPESWFLRVRPELRRVRSANANIVPLCRQCHDLIHDTRDPVLGLKARSALRATLGADELAFIIQVRGRDWLERFYPRDP